MKIITFFIIILCLCLHKLNIAQETWTTTSIGPVGRQNHTAVWTSSKMIIWGGYNGSCLNDGGLFDPILNNWTFTSLINVPDIRYAHSVVWTGSKMIVWGGYNFNNQGGMNNGGIYDPNTNSWAATSNVNPPNPRFYHSAVWTGNKMIVWGGFNASTALNTGGIYDTVTNSWTSISTTNAPTGRYLQTAVWTGSKMIVWGGYNGSSILNTGGIYDLVNDNWSTISTTNAPTGGFGHSAVWTGSKMIIWGGADPSWNNVNTGGVYDPNTNTWTSTTTTNAPSTRDFHTAAWSGTKMIVWGGSPYTNTGGIYDPISNSWSSTTTTNAPSARYNHSATWTGTSMIVWGGYDGSYLYTGGVYTNSALICSRLSGTLYVGSGQTYTSLTSTSGIFRAIDSIGLCGNLVVKITSNTTESGTYSLNQWIEYGGINYTLTIIPNDATQKNLVGSCDSGLIRLFGADRVIIDGSYNGSGRYLLFQNTSSSSSNTLATIQLQSLGTGQGCSNVQIKNCIVRANNSTGLSAGIRLTSINASSSGADNDSCNIQNNFITQSYYGIWASGTSTSSSGGLDNLLISQNIIGNDTVSNSICNGIYCQNLLSSTISQNTVYNSIGGNWIYGMSITSGSSINVIQNNIYNFNTTGSCPIGMIIQGGTINSIISKNKIYNIKTTSSNGYGCAGMKIISTYFTTISNNLIYDISGDGNSVMNAYGIAGIRVGTCMGLNLYYNSVNLFGNLNTSNINYCAAIYIQAAQNAIVLNNNSFKDSIVNNSNPLSKSYAIYSDAPSSYFTSIDYNDYYAAGSQGYLGYMCGGDKPTLSSWRSCTSQDLHSLNNDPFYTSNTNLIPLATSPLYNSGMPISGIIDDYNGSMRSTSTPTIGAYEHAPALLGIIYVGTGQIYTTLTGNGGLFQAINSCGLSGNLSVKITSNTVEPGTYSLNQWSEYAGSNYTLNISPNDANEKLLSGNVSSSNGLIRLDGAKRVIIDGRFNSSGQYLRFRNIYGSSPTLGFLNGAKYNYIRNCALESNNVLRGDNGTGTISFFGGNSSTSNDSNTITFNDIRDRSDALGVPAIAIYSIGNSTGLTVYNKFNIISNNNIYNFCRDSTFSSGIYLDSYNDSWTISGNSFYWTLSSFGLLGNFSAWYPICLTTNGTGNNMTVSNNYIGGSQPQCGGLPWTANSSVSTNNIYFYGIYINSLGSNSASSIQGNTISNINISSYASLSPTITFCGIYDQNGYVNIGDISGNIIGNTSTTGNIIYNILGGNNSFTIEGIDHRGPSGTIQNNIIGSISVTSNNPTGTCNFNGITATNGINVNDMFNIQNNFVGGSVTNSISVGSLIPCIMNGINASVSSPVNCIYQNIINNITELCASTSLVSQIAGIYTSGSAVEHINANTINNLYTSTAVNTLYATNGILCENISSNQSISYNLISTIRNSSNSYSIVNGITVNNNGSTGEICKNRIWDLTKYIGTGSINGIFENGNSSWLVSNNQICITNGQPTYEKLNNKNYLHFSKKNPITRSNEQQNQDQAGNDISIYGIYDALLNNGINRCYYNTVYIGGIIGSGSSYSTCFARMNYSIDSIRNNLFVNARTGGTGYHTAIRNSSVTNWSSNSSNYNVFITSNQAVLCQWISGPYSIDSWRGVSLSDSLSWASSITNVIPSNLFMSISTGNLAININDSTSWIIKGKGIPMAGQYYDYYSDNNVRSTMITSGTTCIGSNEIAKPYVSPPSAWVDNAPGSGVTSTYKLWGRRIAMIYWYPGFSSYPTSVSIQYYSGVNPSNACGGDYSNSHWLFTPSGVSGGFNYDLTLFFADNETYTIIVPTWNTILAKYDGSWWPFPPGINQCETELFWTNYVLKRVKVPLLWSFSDFALTDLISPLPVNISNFKATVDGRNVNLIWTTASEVNNKGFELQIQSNSSRDNSAWSALTFINGHGTTNKESNYSYKIMKLNTGKYSIRLKQVDYNGNAEYFNLKNPSEVLIGAPLSNGVSQNYPNPSNPLSKIDYQLKDPGVVQIKLYDIIGKEVKTLVNEYKEPGYYTVVFDGSNLASGVYFYRIQTGKYSSVKKMVNLK